MNVGENIRRIRKNKRMSMKELGKKVGVTEQGIGNYERGDRKINLYILNKIAGALDISLDELFTDIKRSFSNKLISAVSEMSYVFLSSDFSKQTESIRLLKAISEETNISLDSLQKCIDENIELMMDEQVKLIHFWSKYQSPEDGTDFEYFMNTNHKYIISHPTISKEVKVILKKETSKDNFEKLLDLLDQNGFEVSISNKDGKNEISIIKNEKNIITIPEPDFTSAYEKIISRIKSYSKFIIEEELIKIQDDK